MSTLPLSRQQIDAAGDLDFDARRRPAEPVTITAHVLIDGFHYEVCFSGQVDQLPALSKRLRELGAEPVSAAPGIPAHDQATNGSSKPKAERVQGDRRILQAEIRRRRRSDLTISPPARTEQPPYHEEEQPMSKLDELKAWVDSHTDPLPDLADVAAEADRILSENDLITELLEQVEAHDAGDEE